MVPISRPPFVTLYAVFTGALGALILIGGLFGGLYALAARSPVSSDYQGAIILSIIGLIPVLTAIGLWRMKRWALILATAYLMVIVIGSILLVIGGWFLAILSGLVGLYAFYWFIAHKAVFR